MTSRRRRRALAVARLGVATISGVLAIPWIGGVGEAEADERPPGLFEARAEARAVTNSVSASGPFETSTPYSLSEAQNNSSHGLHAVLHPGVLSSAAASQQSSPPLATTETLYPEGPVEGQADLLPLPAGVGGDWGSAGRSSGRSDSTGSSGEAHYGGFAPSSDVSVQSGQARTSAKAGTVVRSTAEVELQDVHIAGFAANSVTTLAEAAADGSRGGARTSGSVTFVGATLMGTPVTLTPTGLTVGGSTAAVPDTPAVDDLLAEAGVSVRRLPDTHTTSADGTESRLEIGGVEVRYGEDGQALSGSFVLGRASVRARAVRMAAAPGIPPEVPTPPELTPEAPTSELFPGVAGSLLSGSLPAPAPAPAPNATGGPVTTPAGRPVSEPVVAGETVVAPAPGDALWPANPRPQGSSRATSKRDAAPAADWPALAAVIALAIPGALVLRRILRSGAAPGEE